MDLAPVLERLHTCLTGVREVAAAAGLDAAMQGNLVAPAVYVVELSESAHERPQTGAHRLVLSSVVGVIQVVDCLRAAAQPAELHPLRMQVRNALAGWVPDPATGEPMTYLGGQLVQLEGDGRLWWSDEFQLTHYYRSNP